MHFRLIKSLFIGVIFLFFFNAIAYCQISDIPLPADTRLVSQKSANIGPTQSFINIYETSLTPVKLQAFFKREMLRAGWVEQQQGFYMKDNYLSAIVVMPSKNKKDKARFSVSYSRIPTKEEILALRKDNPDKLSFMPIYPESKQVFLWDLPTGLSASYETEKEIKDVVFFYKNSMLSYGWTLVNEAPITSEEAQVNCPDCQKPRINKGISSSVLAQERTVMSKAILNFNRKGAEKCIIRIFQSEPGSKGLVNVDLIGEGAPLLSKKTIILVTYYEPKN
jgi:hypothetical protein